MALRGVDALLEEIQKTKVGLKDVDKTIARITGRDPNDQAPRDRGLRRPRGAEDGRGRQRIFAAARRGMAGDEGPPNKRRVPGNTAFSRLGPRVVASRLNAPRYDMDSGDEEDPTYKPAIQSSVVATPTSNRSREDVADAQSKDRESKGRNRRMFGLLLGTLKKFKLEEQEKTDKEKLRKAVEDKLEQKAKQEQIEVRLERRKLFEYKQRKEQKIKQLEQKMELVKIHEQWASQTQMLGNFIRTKSRPHLYYMPKHHSSVSKDRLKQTKDMLDKIIVDRRKQLEEEIQELTHVDDGDEDEEEEARAEPKKREHAERKHDNNEAVTDMQTDPVEPEDRENMGTDLAELGSMEDKENVNEMEGEAEGLREEGGEGKGERDIKAAGNDSHSVVGEIPFAGADNKPGEEENHEKSGPDSDRNSDRKKRSSRKRTHSHRDRESHKGEKENHGEGEGEGEGGDSRTVVSEIELPDSRTVQNVTSTSKDDSRKVVPMDADEK